MNHPRPLEGRSKVLFVDDDEQILDGLRRTLGRRFTLDTAPGGQEALALMEARGPYAVVVSDMRMPGMNGLEFLSRAAVFAPDTVRIMLTGHADLRTAQEAVNQGQIFLFLTKPCSPEDLDRSLESAIRQYDLVTAEKEVLERTLAGCVQLLMDILGTFEHLSQCQTGLTSELAYRLGLDLGVEDPWEIRVAAMLSSIGLVTVPPGLMARFSAGEALGDEGDALLAYLPETSAGLLGYIPRLERITEIVLYQAKNYDGSGFPEDGLAGEGLPLGSRILRVASVFVALEEAYGSGDAALEEMRQQKDWFDPRVLAALARIQDHALPRPSEALPRSVPELQSGDLLVAPVEALNGELIAPSGLRVSPALMEKLGHYREFVGLKEPILVYPAEGGGY